MHYELVTLGAVGIIVPILALAACGKEKATPPSPVTTHAEESRKLSVAECQKVFDESDRRADAIFNGADRSCKTGDDCAEGPRRPLGGDCGGHYVNKNAVAKVTQDNDTQTQTLVRQWEAGGCASTLPLPMPSCMIPHPVCSSSLCAWR